MDRERWKAFSTGRVKDIDAIRAAVREKSNRLVELLTQQVLLPKQAYSFRCLRCKTEYKTTLGQFFKSRSDSNACPKCCHDLRGKMSRKYSEENVVKRLAEHGYKIHNGIYETLASSLYLKCPDSAHPPYKTSMEKFFAHRRCPYCKKARVDFELQIRPYVESPERLASHGGTFQLLTKPENFVNSTRTPLLINKLNCDHEPFQICWSYFSNPRRPSGCPQCYAENRNAWAYQLLTNMLRSSNISFQQEKAFPGLVNPRTGYRLRFDIYIPSIHTAVEIDGAHHFKPTIFGGMDQKTAEARYQQQQVLDRIKEEFATQNGIKLCRIPIYDVEQKRALHRNEVLEVVKAQVARIHTLTHGIEISIDPSVYLNINSSKLARVREKVEQRSEGRIAFIDSSFHGYRGADYLLKCMVNPEHGTFTAPLRHDTSCPKCSEERMRQLMLLTPEQIRDSLSKFSGRILFIDDQYQGRHSNHRFYCTDHDIEFNSTLGNVLASKSGGCPKCNVKGFSQKRCPPAELSRFFFETVIAPSIAAEPGYELVTTAEEHGSACNNRLMIRHTKCGHTFSIFWSRWKAGSRCPHRGCRPARTAHNRTSEQLVKEIIAGVHGGEYSLDERYRGMRERHRLVHKPSGQYIFTTIDNFRRGKFQRVMERK